MNIKVNCKYSECNVWCTNKNIKRSILGLGTRLCILNDTNNCEYQEQKSRRPKVKPAPQPDNSFITALREDWGREDVCGPWTEYEKYDPDKPLKFYKRYWFISYNDGDSPNMETL